MVVQSEDRSYPLKRPSGHKVPVPRWTLRLPDGITHIYTLYVGVQSRSANGSAVSRAEQAIQDWLDQKDGQPTAVDTFRVTNGFDLADSKVWVAYWTESAGFQSKLGKLNLMKLWQSLGDDKDSAGVWCEHFITPIERLETNYASLKHQPGLAQIPGSEFPEHDLTAYWGAGRDRIPAAAHDLFKPPKDTDGPDATPKGIGEHLTGTNYNNMCHIRKRCNDADYSSDLADIVFRKRTMVDSMRPRRARSIRRRPRKETNERNAIPMGPSRRNRYDRPSFPTKPR